MAKYIQNKLPDSFKGLFPFNNEILTTRTTRQSELVYIRHPNNEYAAKFPIICCPQQWNKWSDNNLTEIVVV